MTGVALITGGQQGIGLGIARALIPAGFRVALVSLPAATDETVRIALQQLGPGARYFQHDLADIEKITALLDAVEQDMGPVTALICNAGVPAKVRGDMLDMTPDSFDFVLGINVRGTFFLAQEAARRMLAQTKAKPAKDYQSITFVTSVNATMASVERAEYCISKAAGAMTAQLFAARLAPHGIGVFELRPGIIETAMTAQAKDKHSARIESGLVPAGRWGQPADVGMVVVPLVTGQFAFATGSVIPVDGGLSIIRL